MLGTFLASHVIKAGASTLVREKEHRTVKTFGIALLAGPFFDFHNAHEASLRLQHEGYETEHNIKYRIEVLYMGLFELFESVPQVILQTMYINDLRESIVNHDIQVDLAEYFFAVISPRIGLITAIAICAKALAIHCRKPPETAVAVLDYSADVQMMEVEATAMAEVGKVTETHSLTCISSCPQTPSPSCPRTPSATPALGTPFNLEHSPKGIPVDMELQGRETTTAQTKVPYVAYTLAD